MINFKKFFYSWNLKKVKSWYHSYERYLIPGALLFGIITDFIMFRNINLDLSFKILFTHLVVSGLVIIWVHFYDKGTLSLAGRWGRMLEYGRLFSPLLIQYTFGALLSGFFIFYWFSGAFSASWPFILLIIFLMISNDILKKYYLRTIIRLSVYYFIIFSYLVLILPFWTKQMGALWFLMAGLISLGIFVIYFFILNLLVPVLKAKRTRMALAVLIIFTVMNGLYFFNFIPPIPLSMREAGVYHEVSRLSTGDYEVVAEKQSWWERWLPGQQVHLTKENSTVYVFASVFAPTELETDIIHRWQYKDPKSGWQTISRVQFPMVGGRDGGYRGYSFSQRLFPGRFRVDVETVRGQVVGRINFKIVATDELPNMVVKIK
ncbi:MAG: DUF2914 domain-containing protein [Patescibacteria group bacterium]